jgi:hypothetical protein
MKDRWVKQVLPGRWVPVEGERVNGEGKGGQIWSLYFIYLQENKTMKPVEID